MVSKFTLSASALAVFAMVLLPHAKVQAQPYPSRPVTWVVPSPAGGVTDLSARVIAKTLSAKIGQPVIVDPRPGAGGIVATEFVAGAKPDGYTLLYATSGTIATIRGSTRSCLTIRSSHSRRSIRCMKPRPFWSCQRQVRLRPWTIS